MRGRWVFTPSLPVPLCGRYRLPLLRGDGQLGQRWPFVLPCARRPFMTKKTLLKSRSRAYREQGGRCWYCRALTWRRSPGALPRSDELPSGVIQQLQATAEHLVPRCEGGSDTRENVVMACRACNRRRHARPKPMPPSEYRRHVVRRIAQGRWHPPAVFRAGLVEIGYP